MNRGDFQTFYPMQAGLIESGFCPMGSNESGYDPNDPNDPALDDSKDNQDSTSYENEHTEEPVPDSYLPCFREEVQAKKKELKAQYGKGHISIGECGIEPLSPDIDVSLWDVPCFYNCNKHPGHKCCETNIKQAQKRANIWEDRKRWQACHEKNKGIWVPGWRKEWRKFKKAGGLKEIKQRSTRCILGAAIGGGGGQTPQTPPPTPPPTPPAQKLVDLSGMTCQDMATQYGIVPGFSFGTAPDNVKTEWTNRACTLGSSSGSSGSIGTALAPIISGRANIPGSQTPVVDDKAKNKKMMIIGGIAVVVIITIALVVRAMRSGK